MSEFTALFPTQQAALLDAVQRPLRRCRGGYAADPAARIHTVRCINALSRAGLVQVSDDVRAVTPTEEGYRVAGGAPLEHAA
jgi:hypothetical protein